MEKIITFEDFTKIDLRIGTDYRRVFRRAAKRHWRRGAGRNSERRRGAGLGRSAGHGYRRDQV